VITKPCPRCDGAGRAPKKIPVEVPVPAGVPVGATLRIAGQGEAGDNGAPRGELFCNIHLREHELFERHDNDVVCRVPVGYSQAALGAEVEVPALGGKKTLLRVKPGTQSGEVYRLKGLGIPRYGHGGRGDQLVQIFVEVPRKLAPQHEELLRRLAELEDKNVSPQRKSFVDKLRKYFSSEDKT
jgi:molecular chaperone DnaJ